MSVSFLCGIDEAGRGPLAGPVTAACVILPRDFPISILNDSKKLSEKKRAAAEIIIKEKSLWGIGIVSHEIIDKINILQASLQAMSLAFDDMTKKLHARLLSDSKLFGIEIKKEDKIELSAIVDGTFCPPVNIACKAEVKADSKYPQVMAASILAKVCRDKIMLEYDKLYPQYGYARHKGYPTKAHREICRKIGASPIQRLSFKY